jgi:hypothetical protein
MRGRRYSVDGEQAVASPDDSVLGITSTTAVRPTIYDLLIGSAATPADNALEWYLQRYTAAGTATSVTPLALDPGDPASTTTSGENHTVEPTYTSNAILFRLALNQRASHRWIADPDGGLVCPATNSNGIGAYPVHASFTGLVSMTMHFQE